MSTVSPGQVWRWLGAEVLIDEVDADGKGARITIRQPGARPWQKWAPLPFPAEAVLLPAAAAVQAAAVEIASLP